MANRLPIIGVVAAVVLFLLYSSVFVVNAAPAGDRAALRRDRRRQDRARHLFQGAVRLLRRRQRADHREPACCASTSTTSACRFRAASSTRSTPSSPIASPIRACSAQAVSGQIELAEARLRTRLDAALRRVYGLRGFEAALSEERAVMMREVRDQLRPDADVARPADRGCAHPPHRPDGRGLAADLRPHEGRTSGRGRAAAGARQRGGAAHHAPAPTAKWSRSSPRRSKESEILRGEGEAQRSATFADAYQRDPAFFDFYRSMNAYGTALDNTGTTMVLSPNSEFFRFFRNPDGKAPPATPATPPAQRRLPRRGTRRAAARRTGQ